MPPRIKSYKKQVHIKTAAAAGFSLIELLAVMAILAVLMGIGVGVFSKINVAKFSAVGIVRNALRNARESAISSGVPVTVVCDPEENKLYDLSVKPFAHWAFEDASDHGTSDSVAAGAFDLVARMHGARVASGGRIGGALYFNKAGDHALCDLGENAKYAFSNGVSAEADVYFTKPISGNLLKRTKQFRLSIAGDGSVEAEVQLVESEEPDARPAGSVVVASAPNSVLAGQWAHVGFVYDRLSLVVYVDGIPRATKLVKAREAVARDNSPLEFGDKSATVIARIDDAKVGVVAPGEGIQLPKEVTFGFSGGPISLHFLTDGRLDPVWHSTPAVVPLQFPENVKKTVTVGVYGTAR